MSSEKKERLRFNEKLLNEMMNKYDAKLTGEYDKLTGNTMINFICSCGNERYKEFKRIPLLGALCEKSAK